MAISGSDWQLGSWDPKQSWYLNTSPETPPVCQVASVLGALSSALLRVLEEGPGFCG